MFIYMYQHQDPLFREDLHQRLIVEEYPKSGAKNPFPLGGNPQSPSGANPQKPPSGKPQKPPSGNPQGPQTTKKPNRPRIGGGSRPEGSLLATILCSMAMAAATQFISALGV
ncbi:hypothetical protein PoB_004173600 [Plakobranchus ocellatus]|uniref:Uncharacterized protein n=1 Tax=Plakobranchus ocellatus TaxID=259542 RepID=A0AAV4B447_9GAST|nr:hypothetical protein PoB_004173600 [Plakobranchus ocellatus]